MRKVKIIRRCVLAGLLLILICGFYSGPVLRRYQVNTGIPGEETVRIVLLADLHAEPYGEGQEKLVRRIDAQEPDLVVMAGDLFSDGGSDAPVEALLEAIAGKYPCYYATGNHDYWNGPADFQNMQAMLEEYGVVTLDSEKAALTINGKRIDLFGIADPNRYRYAEDDPEYETFPEALAHLSSEVEEDVYSILISHRPEYFPSYEETDFDLVLAGHAHGGQWRIPFLLNGLYSPGEGMFPQYAGGEYDSGDLTMIVSRGLSKISRGIPRFFNPTEVVVIDLVP